MKNAFIAFGFAIGSGLISVPHMLFWVGVVSGVFGWGTESSITCITCHG